MRLGLLPTDTATSTNVTPVKEQSRLVKLGLLPCDATASQNKARAESVDEAGLDCTTDTATYYKC